MCSSGRSLIKMALLFLFLRSTADAVNCCVGIYAPGEGCLHSNGKNGTLKCIDNIDGCTNCQVSDAWVASVRCTSCCAKKKETCPDGNEATAVGIISLMVVILTCACCSGVVIFVEQRRRLRHAALTGPIAEARIESDPLDADVIVPKDDDEEEVDEEDGRRLLPVARPQAPPAHGVPLNPLDLGSISTTALLSDDYDNSSGSSPSHLQSSSSVTE